MCIHIQISRLNVHIHNLFFIWVNCNLPQNFREVKGTSKLGLILQCIRTQKTQRKIPIDVREFSDVVLFLKAATDPC